MCSQHMYLMSFPGAEDEFKHICGCFDCKKEKEKKSKLCPHHIKTIVRAGKLTLCVGIAW